MNKYSFKFDDHIVVLNFEDFKKEIDVDKLLLINYSNIESEIVTFPIILNKLGVLLAEAENKVKERKLSLELWENSEKERVREALLIEKRDMKYTNDDINYYMRTKVYGSSLYRAKSKALSKAEKEHSILNSVYWSAKDKSDKLNLLFQKLHPEELAIEKIGDSFNGVKIKVKKPAIN